LDTEIIIQDDEEFEVAVFTRDTRIKDVRHSLVPIEYPETSEEGIAYIYHIENWADPKAAFHDVSLNIVSKILYKKITFLKNRFNIRSLNVVVVLLVSDAHFLVKMWMILKIKSGFKFKRQ